ncbi:MAG TPA: hypothetical protein VLM16_05890 [Ginsengibacter sp.]|nr:hypothetical protein [Ginsengibacter sp.]
MMLVPIGEIIKKPVGENSNRRLTEMMDARPAKEKQHLLKIQQYHILGNTRSINITNVIHSTTRMDSKLKITSGM